MSASFNHVIISSTTSVPSDPSDLYPMNFPFEIITKRVIRAKYGVFCHPSAEWVGSPDDPGHDQAVHSHQG